MGKLERRNSMTLDEVGRYWRELRGIKSPSLNKSLNSIITIDLAFEGSLSSLSKHLSKDKWERIRSDLFDVLLSSFPGSFNLYQTDGTQIDILEDWPESAIVEFVPVLSSRKSDILRADMKRLHPAIVLGLRWCWAEGRNEID